MSLLGGGIVGISVFVWFHTKQVHPKHSTAVKKRITSTTLKKIMVEKVLLYFLQSEIIKFVTPRSPCRDFLDRLAVSHMLLLAVNSKREYKIVV